MINELFRQILYFVPSKLCTASTFPTADLLITNKLDKEYTECESKIKLIQ